MPENPYQPPTAPLTEHEPQRARPGKRFRFRIVPAALCIFYGGALSLALAGQVVLVASVAARVGIARLDIGPVMLIFTVLGLSAASFLVAGSLWHRGKWGLAVAATLFGFALGFVMDPVGRRGWERQGPTRSFLQRIVKDHP